MFTSTDHRTVLDITAKLNVLLFWVDSTISFFIIFLESMQMSKRERISRGAEEREAGLVLTWCGTWAHDPWDHQAQHKDLSSTSVLSTPPACSEVLSQTLFPAYVMLFHTSHSFFWLQIHKVPFVICLSCHNKMPQTRYLKQQAFIFSHFRRPEVQDQGFGRFGFFWGLSWLAGHCLLAVSSQGLSLVAPHPWCLFPESKFPLLIKTLVRLN